MAIQKLSVAYITQHEAYFKCMHKSHSVFLKTACIFDDSANKRKV